MIAFTNDELCFIYENGLTEDDFYDGRGERKRERHDNAQANGCNYVVAGECHNGHRLKTRSGHCIQCNPAVIAFQKRNRRSGAIYVAENGDFCKVGVVDDNIKDIEQAIHNREIRLNLEGGYGGITGWKIIAWAPVEHDLGKIEDGIHRQLSQFSIKTKYTYSGNRKMAQEMFKCDRNEAIDRIDEAITPQWTFA